MADVRLSDLSQAASVVSSDLLEISQFSAPSSYESKKISFATLKFHATSTVEIREVSAEYTVQTGDQFIIADASGGDITVNLPDVSNAAGRILHIKKIDSSGNDVIVDAYDTETIDGEVTQPISTQYAAVSVVSDGSTWHVF
jgi:hypothetical protein